MHRRWIIAFGFGLVHGFGFSFALKETLQFAGSHLLTSLLGFNIGVELGTIAGARYVVPADRTSCSGTLSRNGWEPSSSRHWSHIPPGIG